MIRFTIRQLRNLKFSNLYCKLINRHRLSDFEKTKLLKLAVVFLNSKDSYTKEFGYRIILKYCNMYQEYRPLYDVAINLGYIPISKYIENNYLDKQQKESFLSVFISSYEEQYRENNIFLTIGQFELNNFFREHLMKDIAIVAPTSYGKSELILSLIEEDIKSNICILVPTKSLLAQTKRRILKYKGYSFERKIITHPDMCQKTDEGFLAVLTQERLLRLLQKDSSLSFSTVVIDEAHNILSDDYRARLLASGLIILKHRCKKTHFKFLTPFLLELENLRIKHSNIQQIKYKVEENIKTESYYLYDFKKRKVLKLYDQYLNEFYEVDCPNYDDDLDLIFDMKEDKNVIYLNKPTDIEKISNQLYTRLKKVEVDELSKACSDLAEYIHEEYLLIDCLEHGFVYHHGSVPDNIRLYIEHLYATYSELSIIVTSSTLLEGVNIPASKMFILSKDKGRRSLSYAQFRNLVGRVCRFGEIFSENNGSLEKLEPKVFLVKSDYMQSNANIESFIQNVAKVDKKQNENAENVLLESTEINENNQADEKEAEEFIENQEDGIINSDKVRKTNTKLGKTCFKNSVFEFDIFKNESEIQKDVDELINSSFIIDTSQKLIDVIVKLFICHIEDNDDNRKIFRLNEIKAQNFYRMFINWKLKQASYSEMIGSFLNHWEKLVREEGETLVFVDKWGDTTRERPNMEQEAFRLLYTDIKEKSPSERVNLAIVRIKEEQDFVENNLMKFVEILNDLELLDSSFYFQLKYGTDDKEMIVIIKNGIGLQTAKLLQRKYKKFISVDIDESTVFIEPEIIGAMKTNGENEIVIYEISCNIKN